MRNISVTLVTFFLTLAAHVCSQHSASDLDHLMEYYKSLRGNDRQTGSGRTYHPPQKDYYSSSRVTYLQSDSPVSQTTQGASISQQTNQVQPRYLGNDISRKTPNAGSQDSGIEQNRGSSSEALLVASNPTDTTLLEPIAMKAMNNEITPTGNSPNPTSSPTPATTIKHSTASKLPAVPTTIEKHLPTTTSKYVPTSRPQLLPKNAATHEPSFKATAVPISTPRHLPKTTTKHVPTTTMTPVPTTTLKSVPTSTPLHLPKTTTKHVPTTTMTPVPTTTLKSVLTSTPLHLPKTTTKHVQTSTETPAPTSTPKHLSTTSMTSKDVPTSTQTLAPTTTSKSLPFPTSTIIPTPKPVATSKLNSQKSTTQTSMSLPLSNSAVKRAPTTPDYVPASTKISTPKPTSVNLPPSKVTSVTTKTSHISTSTQALVQTTTPKHLSTTTPKHLSTTTPKSLPTSTSKRLPTTTIVLAPAPTSKFLPTTPKHIPTRAPEIESTSSLVKLTSTPTPTSTHSHNNSDSLTTYAVESLSSQTLKPTSLLDNSTIAFNKSADSIINESKLSAAMTLNEVITTVIPINASSSSMISNFTQLESTDLPETTTNMPKPVVKQLIFSHNSTEQQNTTSTTNKLFQRPRNSRFQPRKNQKLNQQKKARRARKPNQSHVQNLSANQVPETQSNSQHPSGVSGLIQSLLGNSQQGNSDFGSLIASAVQSTGGQPQDAGSQPLGGLAQAIIDKQAAANPNATKAPEKQSQSTPSPEELAELIQQALAQSEAEAKKKEQERDPNEPTVEEVHQLIANTVNGRNTAGAGGLNNAITSSQSDGDMDSRQIGNVLQTALNANSRAGNKNKIDESSPSVTANLIAENPNTRDEVATRSPLVKLRRKNNKKQQRNSLSKANKNKPVEMSTDINANSKQEVQISPISKAVNQVKAQPTALPSQKEKRRKTARAQNRLRNALSQSHSPRSAPLQGERLPVVHPGDQSLPSLAVGGASIGREQFQGQTQQDSQLKAGQSNKSLNKVDLKAARKENKALKKQQRQRARERKAAKQGSVNNFKHNSSILSTLVCI